MPTPTYDLIASNVLSSSASSVTFSSIPATYRDLILVVTVATTANNTGLLCRFNGDTGSNYPYVVMGGNGSSTYSSSGTETYLWLTPYGSIGTNQSLGILQINDYSATDKHKPTLMRFNRADVDTEASAGRWASTSAINQIELYVGGGNSFASGSTFYLYGIVS